MPPPATLAPSPAETLKLDAGIAVMSFTMPNTSRGRRRFGLSAVLGGLCTRDGRFLASIRWCVRRASCSRSTRKDELVTSEEHSGAGRGTLLLADISGYTAFLQAVGRAHAADMAAGRLFPRPIRC